MASKWAVLVVHGVGDTKPGATVDALVPALAVARPKCLRPDGRVEVHWLCPDGVKAPSRPPEQIAPQHEPIFPVHVRRAAVEQSDGSVTEAVFAEVYWADLSRVREGVLHSILAVISTIFLIRFIPDQASVMPDDPVTRSANRARGAARWLRAGCFLSALLLNGPIAGLCLLLLGVLLIDDVVLPHLDWTSLSAASHDALMIACGLAAALGGGLTWWYGRSRGWGTTWTRVWGAFSIVGLLFAAVLAAREGLSQDARDGSISAVARWVGYSMPDGAARSPQTGISPHLHGPILLLAGIQFAFVSISMLVVVGLGFWLFALWNAPPPWRPPLTVAYGAALLQIALWILVIPILAMLIIRTAITDLARREEINHLLDRVQGGFALFLLVALLIGALAMAVWGRRSRWVSRFRGPLQFPLDPPEIARLIVNSLLVGAVVALTASACALSVVSAFSTVRPNPVPAPWAVAAGVPILGIIFGYFREGLRSWIHIITDIINHFYKRCDRFPKPWGPEEKAVVGEFEIQQQIEARFRAVLRVMLDDADVSCLSVISHSQGTIVAIDTFSRSGMDAEYDQWLTRRLASIGRLNLITMGSPLTHLYQHYFPSRYDPLASARWNGLKSSVRSWLNVYRIDDYIGTFIDPASDVPVSNVPIHAGGHTCYWAEPAVYQAVLKNAPTILPPGPGC